MVDPPIEENPFGGEERLTATQNLAIVVTELFSGIWRKDVIVSFANPLLQWPMMDRFSHPIDEFVAALIIFDPYQTWRVQRESRELLLILSLLQRVPRRLGKCMTDPCDHPFPWALCNFLQPCFVNHNVTIGLSRGGFGTRIRLSITHRASLRHAPDLDHFAQRRFHIRGRTRPSDKILESFPFPYSGATGVTLVDSEVLL